MSIARKKISIPLTLLLLFVLTGCARQVPPSFCGHWKFDLDASMKNRPAEKQTEAERNRIQEFMADCTMQIFPDGRIAYQKKATKTVPYRSDICTQFKIRETSPDKVVLSVKEDKLQHITTLVRISDDRLLMSGIMVPEQKSRPKPPEQAKAPVPFLTFQKIK